MELLEKIVTAINDVLWGPPLLILLVATHLYMTVRTGFIQRKIGTALKLSFTSDAEGAEGDISQFGALSTALAATIGTGNIIGVGVAIALGGPGAVFWLWMTGVLGMATKYAECMLAVKYRVKSPDGRMNGGAMYILERALHAKWAGWLFALFGSIAAFGIGSSVQTNAIASTVQLNFGVPPWVTGVIVGILVALTLIGGVKSIARVCEWLVPFMTVFYIICNFIIIGVNWRFIGPAAVLMVTSAFSPQAMGGAVIGAGIMAAMRWGIAKGLFSNEAGMGSAPMVAASATTKNAARQGLVSMSGVFWDTVIGCLMTGFVMVTAILAHPELFPVDPKTGLFAINGSTISSLAYKSTLGTAGTIILTLSLALFAFATVLGWSHYGERAAEYLFGMKGNLPYRVIYTATAIIGCLMSLKLVWDISDTLNALMVLPNIVAILLLGRVVYRETKHYVWDGNLDEIDPRPVPVRGEDGSLPPEAYGRFDEIVPGEVVLHERVDGQLR